MKYLLALIVLGSVTGVTAQMKMLSFYEIRPTAKAPVIDGKLDDECWKNAVPYTSYYEYFKSNPGKAPIKTEMRMLYDENGLYLAVVNYEKDITKLRCEVTDNDNLELWTDDSSEIYIDHRANGIGYRKFMINAIGTTADMRRVDTALSLLNWSGTGWFGKTSINQKDWTFEIFFPWEDLGAKAKFGDIWTFCHVRFSRASGKGMNATSSPGGNYQSPDNFGFIYFGGNELNSPDKIGDFLRERATPPWGLEMDGKLICSNGPEVEVREISLMIAEAVAKMKKINTGISNDITDKFAEEFRKLQREQQKIMLIKNPDMVTYNNIDKIIGKLRELKAKIALEKEYN